MAIQKLQSSLARIFRQRCFYLFLSILLLIVAAPFLTETLHGRVLVQAAEVLVLIASVAAVGRTTMPFVIALLFGIPAFVFQSGITFGYGDSEMFRMYSNVFHAAFYLVAIVYLLGYVFSPDVMTDDKLFGAASVYLLVAVMFGYVYMAVQLVNPPAFGVQPGERPRPFYDLLYMSFGVLTSNGPGDVTPVGAKVRSIVILEQIVGVLYVAILIARLAGIYPPRRGRDAEQPKPGGNS
jgi:hypothetical protein